MGNFVGSVFSPAYGYSLCIKATKCGLQIFQNFFNGIGRRNLTAAYLPASVALAFTGTPAALLAAITMGISGEHAASGSKGPGSFQAALLDEVFCMTDSQLQNQAQIRRIG